MPRELTPEEKELQKHQLLLEGKELIFRYGIKKISVDDIAKAAGIAKGSFYHSFRSKDDFLYELLYQIHEEAFNQVKIGVTHLKDAPSSEKRLQIKQLILKIFHDPQIAFFIEAHDDIQSFLERHDRTTLKKMEEMEQKNYRELFKQLGLENKQPEILQNYVHIIYFGVSHKKIMIEDYLDATVEVMLDGLLNYLEV
ncbi:TetR/AcrR family transcriptional regulator [Enterococcus sp. AZ163]|uniref:TetR/AcrR family transcriptional regulator n=1 Tax=Enterococcus sp. AZ163 TaxID=2774638 RepID=UPI003D2A9977